MMTFAHKIITNNTSPINLSSKLTVNYIDSSNNPIPIIKTQTKTIELRDDKDGVTRSVVFHKVESMSELKQFENFFTKLIDLNPNIFLLGFNELKYLIKTFILTSVGEPGLLRTGSFFLNRFDPKNNDKNSKK